MCNLFEVKNSKYMYK